MRAATPSVVRCLIFGSLLLGMSGCAFVTDLLNPNLAEQFGFDSQALKPSTGSVMVAFRNSTRFPAVFSAFRATNAQDLTNGARNFTVPVDAGSVGNEVLDCPVGLISPGTIGQDFNIDPVAATVQAGTAGTTVAYAGPTLLANRAYACGDIVEIQLATTTTTTGTDQTTTAYVITVRVIPGR